MKQENIGLLEVLRASSKDFVESWMAELRLGASGAAPRAWSNDATEVLSALEAGVASDGDLTRFDDQRWQALRSLLESLSSARAAQGESAGDTSYFVLAIKKPIFAGLQRLGSGDAARTFETTWATSTLVDKMAQWTAATYQRSREDVIRRQQEELLELSTPVIKLWEGVLAVPMIGTLDSSRTQLVMESLLTRIVETGSELAIIDITGVPTVDTLVAQHLLKTVTAIRLMGADCIISGIRPQIAQTVVHLGIDLQGVTTKATLADALALAMKKSGWLVSRPKP